MRILCIDTSTLAGSIALLEDDFVRAEINFNLGRKHTERLLPGMDWMFNELELSPGQVEAIAVGIGPGSFTGLRIGMAASKGIAAGLEIPWISVPTLDALAYGLDYFPGAVAPIIDAKKSRVYSAIYIRGARTTDWLDIPLAKLAALLDTYPEALVTGPDAELFSSFPAERSGFKVDERAGMPAARAIALLGLHAFLRDGPGSTDEGPLYLRSSGAEEPVSL